MMELFYCVVPSLQFSLHFVWRMADSTAWTVKRVGSIHVDDRDIKKFGEL